MECAGTGAISRKSGGGAKAKKILRDYRPFSNGTRTFYEFRGRQAIPQVPPNFAVGGSKINLPMFAS